jgi:hypothetical protein
MAISTVSAIKAKRQAFSLIQTLGLSSSASQLLSTLLQELSQKKGNPDLQVVVFDLQTSAASDAVIADAACTIYGIFGKKSGTATGAWIKGSDHATTSSSTASEWMVELNAASKEFVGTFGVAGSPQTAGWTFGADTTASGSTNSTAGDGPKGFVILGA